MEIISPTGSDSTATCKCSVRYAGSRCQYAVGLKSNSLTSHSAELEISLEHTNESIREHHTSETDSKFTLLYWMNFSLSACAMRPDVMSGPLTIGRLESNTKYTFCAVSGLAQYCHQYSVIDRLPVNCVYVTTLDHVETTGSHTYIAPLVLSILFVIGLCIFLAMIINRKYMTCFYKYQSCLKSKRNRDTRNLYMGKDRKRKGDKSRQYLMPLPEPPLPDIVIHPPASPDRPSHKLAQSARGYTSTFSAQNEAAIPLTTVIEDVPGTESPTGDTKFIFHQVETESNAQ